MNPAGTCRWNYWSSPSYFCTQQVKGSSLQQGIMRNAEAEKGRHLGTGTAAARGRKQGFPIPQAEHPTVPWVSKSLPQHPLLPGNPMMLQLNSQGLLSVQSSIFTHSSNLLVHLYFFSSCLLKRKAAVKETKYSLAKPDSFFSLY